MMKLPYAIISDLDGTLASLEGRDPFNGKLSLNDILNDPVANILEVYDNQTLYNISLILISGREEKYREITEKWLKKNGINHYSALYLRQNGDYRKDSLIKKEIYEKYINGKYDVLFVLEDRDQVVKMWRSLGITCLQVDYGNF